MSQINYHGEIVTRPVIEPVTLDYKSDVLPTLTPGLVLTGANDKANKLESATTLNDLNEKKHNHLH